MSVAWGKTNLDTNQRAIELAKIALGWGDMTPEQRMDNARNLVTRATEIESNLRGK